jgi:hypothetical protein
MAPLERRDYILRIIEQMGSALVALRNRILGRHGSPVRIEEDLRALAGRGGVDLEVIRGLSGDTLLMLVSPGGEVEPGRCWLIAELLYLDGLEADVEGRVDDARLSLVKARTLYALVAPGGGMLVGFPEAEDRFRDIDARLGQLEGA